MIYGEEEHPHAECRERIAELEAEVDRLTSLWECAVREEGSDWATDIAIEAGLWPSKESGYYQQ